MLVVRLPCAVLLAAALLCLPACGGNKETRVQLDVLFGLDEYQKAGAQLVVGKKVKVRGQITRLIVDESRNPKEKHIKFQLCEVYTGDEPAFQAADMMRDFKADEAAATAKYKGTPEGTSGKLIVFEGVVSEAESN